MKIAQIAPLAESLPLRRHGGTERVVSYLTEELLRLGHGNAVALLSPIDRAEPFGLAMIEAMSCGTPVIAWRRGSVPEIVDHGVTGFIVDSIDAAVAAVPRAAQLDRSRVRSRFEERFSAARMTRDYLSVYRSLGRTRALRAI